MAFPHGGTFAIANLPPASMNSNLDHGTSSATTLHPIANIGSAQVLAAAHTVGTGLEQATAILPHGTAIQLPSGSGSHPVAVIDPKTLSNIVGVMQAQDSRIKAAVAAAAGGQTTIEATPLFTSPQL